MFVIGTAGHVDHGKSTLVRALTGINPDRLREEQEREMTIDLGFAWMQLPSGREVSIVDVPGHEDFIKNMLAGVGGIDVAMLVVAADEAVMPQTREHLAILDLLQVSNGLVALTKADLIDDPDWLDLVREEVRDELVGTVLEQAPILPVSAVTGAGLAELRAELDRLLDATDPRRDLDLPRLPIDRIFSIAGFGTVVTGTLMDGRLRVGDEVEIVPGGLRARIRGLQSHKAKVQEVEPGARAAINLTGVDTEDLERGQVVTRPGTVRPSLLIDARLRLLPTAPFALKHNALVDLFVGSARAEAHLRLLDVDQLAPGGVAWVQLRLSGELAVARGDRFVIRLASPSLTLGGGQIIQPHPGRRYRRFSQPIIERLEALLRGTPEDLLLQALSREGALEVRDLLKRVTIPTTEALQGLRSLLDSDQVVSLGPLPAEAAALGNSNAILAARSTYEAFLRAATRALEAYHQRNPLRAAMPREELRSRTSQGSSGAAGAFNALLDQAARDAKIELTAIGARLAGHLVLLSADQERAVERVLADFRANPYAPPSMAQVQDALGSEMLQYLFESERLIKIGDGVLFAVEDYTEMERRTREYLASHESITVAQVRDLFGTSRKYALAFLEELDSRRVTRRVGDARVLR